MSEPIRTAYKPDEDLSARCQRALEKAFPDTEIPDVGHVLDGFFEELLSDPKVVIGAAEKLLCCRVVDPTGLIYTALENGASLELAAREEDRPDDEQRGYERGKAERRP